MTETRSQCLLRHVESCIRNTGMSWETYVEQVVEEYHQRVPAPLREIQFANGGDTYKRQRHNADKFHDFQKGKVRLPADLEEACVFALPDDRRDALLAELAGRYGLIAAHLPEPGRAIGHAGRFAQEYGEAAQVLGEMLADGVIDSRDAPRAKRAIKELTDVVAEGVSLIQRVNEIMPEVSAPPSPSATKVRAVR